MNTKTEEKTESKNQLVKQKKQDISAQVLSKVHAFQDAGEIKLPKDYSPENALKSAYLVLSETKNSAGQYALDHCTTNSIANALLKMVTMGLSVAKKQGNFIMYGNQLSFDEEYTGNIVLAKRYGGLKNIIPQTIFEGDDFEFEIDIATGRKRVTKHNQTLESIGSKQVKGAYAVMEMVDGTFNTEIMSISQIKDAWAQGGSKGNSPAHRNFPDQMANKTVINRACKLLIRGSDDAALFYDDEEKEPINVVEEDVKHEIKTKANRKPIDFDDAEYEDVEEQPEPIPGTSKDSENDDAEMERLHEEAIAEEENQKAKSQPDF